MRYTEFVRAAPKLVFHGFAAAPRMLHAEHLRSPSLPVHAQTQPLVKTSPGGGSRSRALPPSLRDRLIHCFMRWDTHACLCKATFRSPRRETRLSGRPACSPAPGRSWSDTVWQQEERQGAQRLGYPLGTYFFLYYYFSSVLGLQRRATFCKATQCSPSLFLMSSSIVFYHQRPERVHCAVHTCPSGGRAPQAPANPATWVTGRVERPGRTGTRILLSQEQPSCVAPVAELWEKHLHPVFRPNTRNLRGKPEDQR